LIFFLILFHSLMDRHQMHHLSDYHCHLACHADISWD